MDDPILFSLTGATVDRQNVREIEGRVGFWPFARTMRFCVGVNCDAIEPGKDGISVFRRGRLIARSASRPGQHTRRVRRMRTEQWLRTLTLP